MDIQKLEKEIAQITASHGCTFYGFADLEGLTPGRLAKFHRGISLVFQMEPRVMDKLAQGPTDAYSVLYGQVNLRLRFSGRYRSLPILKALPISSPIR